MYRHKGQFIRWMEVTCCIPQGSILVPLLFLNYVNDMESAIRPDLLLYADDSVLLIREKKTLLLLNKNFVRNLPN